MYIISGRKGGLAYMGKVIAVASGKGGTGKTTTVAAVSSCLAGLGHKTLCVDFDMDLRNLDLALCMADHAIADFMDVVSGRLDLMEACHENARIGGLYFLAAPAIRDGALLETGAMFADIKTEFEYCVIDCPSGIGDGFRQGHAHADMSIIVTTGELPAMRDAQATAAAVREMGIEDVRLLVNRVLPKNIKWIHTTIDDMIDAIGARLIGLVPEDESVHRALHCGDPLVLYEKRRSAYDFLDVARRIAGETVPIRRWN